MAQRDPSPADILTAERLGMDIEVWVHISDVHYYALQDSIMDRVKERKALAKQVQDALAESGGDWDTSDEWEEFEKTDEDGN